MENSSITAPHLAQTPKPLNSEPRQPMGGSNFEPTGPQPLRPSSQPTAPLSTAAVANPSPPLQRNPLPLKDEILLFEPQKQILYLDAGAVAYIADLFTALRPSKHS